MRRPENLLLVFFGMVATGKSYLASAWAKHYDVPYYNSDRIRKELAGINPETCQREEVDKGIYTPEFSRRTYDALINCAKQCFQADKQACVVLDGSYQLLSERDLLRKHFAGLAQPVFIHCTCAEDVVKKRLDIRENDPDAVSDGNWQIYLAQKKRFQPVLDKEHVIELDTDAPLSELIQRVTAKVIF